MDAKAPEFIEGTPYAVSSLYSRAQSLGNVEGQLLLLFFITIGTGEVAWADKS